MINQVGKVNQLLSICVQLANEAASIIHSIQTGGLKEEKWKGKDDPMTVADVKAQTLIVKGIRKFYPHIQIVGEEEVEFEGDLGYDLNKLNQNLIPEEYFSKGKCDNTFNIDEVVVWVDPLDGTLSYVKEEYDAVTTLIGISHKNQPLMGVTGQPYSQAANSEGKFTFKPKIYFSHISVPTIFYAYGEELKEEGRVSYLPYEFHPIISQNPIDQLIGATSKHRVKPHLLEFILNELKPKTLLQNGGAGKKGLQVLLQEVDYGVHLSSKASRWDILVSQVFLECLGGQLTDIYGEKYLYDPSLPSYFNVNGGVYTLRKDVHDYLISKTKEIKLE